MSIYERSETFVHRISIRDRNGLKVNPSTVSETIYDPCGTILVNSLSMSSDATGEYYYNYNIPANAYYGKYRTKVIAKTSGANTAIYEDKFYIMPWKIERDIRQITGISEKKSITDDDLSDIAWNTYKYALRDVFCHHHKDSPCGNPATGATFDGSNTSFQTPSYPIADINGDGVVTGTTTCGYDMTGWWINSNGHRSECSIMVTQSDNGEITIWKDDGVTPIPADNNGVYIDYWVEYDSFDDDIFKRAVSYLASHEVINRFNELDRTTIADLNSNRPIIISNPIRFMNEYRRYISMIRKPRMGVV